MPVECVGCDEPRVAVQCECRKIYCKDCFEEHQIRKPDHRGTPFQDGPTKLQRAWNYVKGSFAGSTAVDFEKDEGAKWFGLVEETAFTPPICRIVETTRFAEIMEISKVKAPSNQKRQFPSLVSFTGVTGAGKSTLIRALISLSTPKEEDLQIIDAPIVGNSSSLSSTTGEVNLYYDPKTLGTSAPRLYVDCEGLDGTTPIAVSHQKKWVDSAKGYRVQSKQGHQFDRAWAVGDLYPRFMYIFSDVICYVERNPRGFAKVTERLLKWASVAAQKAINQYALPAVILVLNGPPNTGNQSWIFGDDDALTHEFFQTVESQIRESPFVSDLAAKYDVNSVKGILMRCFSSVHVMFVPCKGYRCDGTGQVLGSDENIWLEYGKLLKRIEIDTARVQAAREENWMRFDTKQLVLAFNYAFKHLTKESEKPFDFSDCRSQTDLPKTAEDHITEFLKTTLSGDVTTNFEYAASVVGSCVVMRALRDNGPDLFSHPDAVFNSSIRTIVKSSILSYLGSGLCCAYIDSETGSRCVNTRDGHAKGHQAKDGHLLAPGEYQAGVFGSTDFEQQMRQRISTFLLELDACEEGQKFEVAKRSHQECIRKSNSFTDSSASKDSSMATCYGCLFEAPEYRLPCGHHLCGFCISIFDQTPPADIDYAMIRHNNCFLCYAFDPGHWPFEVSVRPPLSGIRVLSLDGGGVRAVVTLTILKRLEEAIDLSLRPCEYFDLIVGTSAGGMLALGLGEHKWTIDRCMTKYDYIINHGFEAKAATKWWGFGWVARLFRRSMYSSKTLEGVLINAYGEEHALFGLSKIEDVNMQSSNNLPRVAVTTTVDKELKLFTNYQFGNSGDYLCSKSRTWEVARSTSAAPMFFEPFNNSSAGVICRDGGLKQNNPIATAHNEAKSIWGEDVTFDALLSVGTGQSAYPPDRLASSGILPEWLSYMFEHFMTTFNGHDAWTTFYQSIANATKTRSKRLNMKFSKPTEPALDDVSEVPDMKAEAREYEFRRDSATQTFVRPAPTDAIHEVATQIRASLYYFHPCRVKLNESSSVAVVTGTIYCRVPTQSTAFRQLHAWTKGFEVPENFTKMPEFPTGGTKFAISICFQHDVSSDLKLVDVSVKFKDGYSAPISGFPIAYDRIARLVS